MASETDAVRPNTATSATHIQLAGASVRADKLGGEHAALHGGEGESALPEDVEEEALERAEHHWDNDPANARNWSFRKKWLMVFIVSLYTLVSPLASSTLAPALPEIAELYGITNDAIIGLVLSIFLLSFALGPLIIAPLSEIYGRTWVLHINNLIFLAFNLGCAWAPTTSVLLGLRFLVGLAGSAPIAIGGGSVGDLFSERDRASAMAIFSLGPLLGPAIGPVAGGYITQTIGVKWIFIAISCLSGFAALVGIPFLRETYGPVIRLRRAKKAKSDAEKLGPHDAVVEAHANGWHILRVNLIRPAMLLTRSFLCFILSLYMALIYGIYYLMFSTFSDLFGTVYGFGPGATGLCYLGLGIGFILSTMFGASFGNKVYAHLVAKNGGVGKPEMRIPALIAGSFFVPIGVLWYGWSAQAHLSFIMPIIGTGIFGFGMMASFLPIQLYLVDAFTYAASALAAASFLRSFFGFLFPLFAEQMFVALGYGAGNSLLAGLAIILGIPFPIWIWFYGESIRKRSPLNR